MCPNLFKKPKVPGVLPSPAKVADPTQIGDARKAEDLALFDGTPDLRVDRSTTGGGVGSGGSGLGTM
jgi:hypothetical protein